MAECNERVDNKRIQIFAGYDGGLILTRQGKLYAFGTNLNGRFGVQAPEKTDITAPCLIAEEVKHAALGENAVLYVTSLGEVKMIGNGEFARKLKGFSNAVRVFATWVGDGYIIKHEDGRLYGFGANTPSTFHTEWAGRFAPPAETRIYTFDDVKIPYEQIQGGYLEEEEAEAEFGPQIIRKVMQTTAYQELEAEHGKINLKLAVELKENNFVDRPHPQIENRELVFGVSAFLLRVHIYQPVLYTNTEFAESKCFYGCMYNKYDEEKIKYAKKVKKAVLIKEGTLVLHKDHTLAIWKDHAKTGIKYMEDVSDISSAGDFVMILEKSGDILYGEKEKARMLSWWKPQYHMECLKRFENE